MKYIELFAGIGGLGYGLMQAGMTCVGYVEIDKHAHKAYEILHDPRKEMWSAYDIRDVTDDDIRRLGRERGPISLIAAGFPCQAFSVAGKRKGFADKTRGTLFFEIVRFASILRPEFLLLENVDGLRTHDNGRTLGIILGTLDELGYVGGWQVLNSKDFGVPQNRERIFIVASLRNGRARKVFPIRRENGGAIEVVGRLTGSHDQNSRVYGVGELAPTLSTMQGGGQLSQHGNAATKIIVNYGNVEVGGDIATCIDANYYKGLDNHGQRTGVLTFTRQFNGKYGVNEDSTGTLQASRVDKVPMVLADCGQGRKIQDRTGKPVPTIRSQSGDRLGIWVTEPRAVLTPDRLAKRQNGRRTKEPGEPMFTLTAQDLHGVQQGYRIRKLTPLECFRLQSWPDEWYVKLKLIQKPELIEQVDMTRNDITAQVMRLLDEHGVKEGISDSQLYKMAGNGVTSAVAYEIGRRIMMNSDRLLKGA